MDLLKMFLNLLSSRSSFKDHEPAEFQIDDTYSVPVSMLSLSLSLSLYTSLSFYSLICIDRV